VGRMPHPLRFCCVAKGGGVDSNHSQRKPEPFNALNCNRHFS
jgi:hypothetical protein